MGVIAYESNGKEYFKISIHVRSKKNRKIRFQKLLKGFASKVEADEVYLKEYKSACSELARRESEGLTWGEVVEDWREWYKRYPSGKWDFGTVNDYCAIMRNWTPNWLKKPVSKLTIADGFQMIHEAKENGASTQRLYQIKTAVNVIFKWGLGAGKIVNKDCSPVFGIELKKRDEEKLGEILTRDEIAYLLSRAESVHHDWFPIWIVAAYTGLRSGELEALRKPDIQLVDRDMAMRLDASVSDKKEYGFIRVQRQWNAKKKAYTATKGRMFRTVPVSSQLYWFLIDYLEQRTFGFDEYGARVFELFSEHRRGEQAGILKVFCASEGLKEVKFHTFRACFATHLLASGVEEIKVMKIGGWKDRETMMIYIRRAGVDEAGATEKLDLRVRSKVELAEVGSNVLQLFKR